jgi:hypothetical protein
VGLAETNKFAEGYEAIFGKKKGAAHAAKATAKSGMGKKKKRNKKK